MMKWMLGGWIIVAVTISIILVSIPILAGSVNWANLFLFCLGATIDFLVLFLLIGAFIKSLLPEG